MRIRKAPAKRITTRVDKRRDIVNYDQDNSYPQKVLRIINDSGRATMCCDLYSRFLEGEGFEEDSLNEVVVNRKGVLAWDLLQKITEDYSKFHGFAIHVKYNLQFDVASLEYVPFHYCRLGQPDDVEYVGKIAVYDNWDKCKKKIIKSSEINYLHVFNNDPVVIQKQIDKEGGWSKYKGQVLWYSRLGPGVYPLSSVDSVLEDCVTDGQVKTFKYNNVTTNFMASHMLVTKGKQEGEEEQDDLDKDLQEFQGAENSNKIMVVEVEYEEQIPELTPFETVNKDRIFEYTEKSIHENIRKQFFIPAVLAGDLIAGKLGTSEEIYDAYTLYNTLTKKERNIFSRVFTTLFEFWKDELGDNFKIKPNEIDITQKDKLAKNEVTN